VKLRYLSIFLVFSLSCAGSPDPIFYALSTRTGSALSSAPLKIELRNPGLPGYLDRPYIVRRVTAERLELAADERWGAPLDAMVGATLADDLSARLPNCVVFSEAGALSPAADVRVEIEISRFELTDNGSVELVAQVAARWASPDATRMERQTFSLRPTSHNTADLVASMSQVLGLLADAVAQTVRKGPPATVDPSAPPGAPVAPLVVPLPASG
jgi:uncharacterized protein